MSQTDSPSEKPAAKPAATRIENLKALYEVSGDLNELTENWMIN